MQMMTHDDRDIQQYALECISKIMIVKWEHVR